MNKSNKKEFIWRNAFKNTIERVGQISYAPRILAAVAILIGGLYSAYDIVNSRNSVVSLVQDKLDAQVLHLQDRLNFLLQSADALLRHAGTEGDCGAARFNENVFFLSKIDYIAVTDANGRLLCQHQDSPLGRKLTPVDVPKNLTFSANSPLVISTKNHSGDHVAHMILFKPIRLSDKQLLIAQAHLPSQVFDSLIHSAIDDNEANRGMSGMIFLQKKPVDNFARTPSRLLDTAPLLSSTVLGVHAHNKMTKQDSPSDDTLSKLKSENAFYVNSVVNQQLPGSKNSSYLTLITFADLRPIMADWETQSILKIVAVIFGSILVYIFALIIEKSGESLRVALRETQEANHSKIQFLSHMSHELRTPLNAVIGYSDLIFHYTTEKEHREFSEKIMVSAQHLLRLIDDVLDYSILDAGKIALSKEIIRVDELFDDCLTVARPLAETKGVQLFAHLYDHLSIVADRTRVKQVMVNFITNAVKYGPQPGEVHLLAKQSDGKIRLEVQDNGDALTPAIIAQLFQPFSRLEQHRKSIEGVGIGLALSKQLTQVMGGEIGAESRPEGGNTFWISLPASQTHCEVQPVLKSQVSTTLIASTVTGNVLYVEDNAVNAMIVQSQFKKVLPDVELTIARDGAEAHIAMDKRVPDVLLIDLQLPDCDGFTLLMELRKRGVSALAYAFTADALPATEKRALESGFCGLLHKPARANELKEVVERGLNSHTHFPAA